MRTLLLLALLGTAPAAARAQYVIEPPSAGTLQGAGSVPQLGSGLAGPSVLAMAPPAAPVLPPSLPTVGIPGSTIFPGGGLPMAMAPAPLPTRPR